ncbi:CIC11C00000005814 [Sungouiella intermedia]|uniref:CIC11C00000005814 n=1 Tax=Sungouiella intermedia TaxID=45354 RepID=A0A1L0C369_9ASCO|nr:CIC11C00000005814 [[Candida] intermedia]
MSSATNSATVYGGDEINAIVLDGGSYTTRIGYSGDDFPKVIQNSYYLKTPTKTLFGGDMELPRLNQEVIPIMKESIINDWEGALAMYKYYFDDVLKIDYQEQPILITEPVWTTKDYRQQLVETFYEEFNFPALYLARTPACVSFQQGRLSCLVVDIGHDQVSVVPVVDGICLLKNSMKTNYGGHYLNDQIQDTLKSKYLDLSLVPKYKVKDKTATVYPERQNTWNSYDQYQEEKIYTEFKELLLEVPEKKMNSSNAQHMASVKELYGQDDSKRMIEFPSGQSLEVSMDRFRLADALFDPASYPFKDSQLAEEYPNNNGELSISSPYDDYRPLKRARKAESGQSTPTPAPENGNASTVRGLSQMISHAIASVDIDLRTSIAHNIIITGGVSLIPQLTERLHTELLNLNPGLKIRLHAIGNANERTNQAWIGGSVLASLGTFHQMWVTKAEYDEAGVDRIFTQRFR